MNMEATGLSLMLLICSINLGSASSKFVTIECQEKQIAQFGQDSLLECVVITANEVKDFKIKSVKWTRYRNQIRSEVLTFPGANSRDSYSFADPHWSNTNKNVSLFISKAAVQHEGHYECKVDTTAGDAKSKLISLNVAANYTLPALKLTENKSKNEERTLECKSIGYPKGWLYWFDKDDKNQTQSATMESREMEDGRFELTSQLPLLKGSISDFSCAVFNFAGNKEHQISLPDLLRGEGPTAGTSTERAVQIAAPLVVIGSLVVALLLLVTYKLYCKRRHHQIPITKSDVEEGDNESSILEPND